MVAQPGESGNAEIKNILPNWVMTVPFLRNGRGCQHMKVRLTCFVQLHRANGPITMTAYLRLVHAGKLLRRHAVHAPLDSRLSDLLQNWPASGGCFHGKPYRL